MVQDSLPYKRVLRTQALYTWILVRSDSLLLVHTRFTSLAMDVDALPILFWSSVFKEIESDVTEPKYTKSCTTSSSWLRTVT